MRMYSGMKGFSGLKSCQHTETVESKGLKTVQPFGVLHYVNGTHINCKNCGYHLDWQPEEGGEQVISYGQLYKKAQRVASGLLASGLRQGETVAIMLPTSKVSIP